MSAADKVLFKDPYLILSVTESCGLYHFVRSTVPYPSLEAIETEYAAVLGIIATGLHPRRALLVDMRLAPARNDPAFEETQRHYRQRMLSRFLRIATLVNTPAGLLHVQRFSREDRIKVVGFTSEHDALQYLLSETES